VDHFVERFDLHSMRRANEKRSNEVCDARYCPITVFFSEFHRFGDRFPVECIALDEMCALVLMKVAAA
jgi:hypothetical protein